jgi:hypothetical protein
LINTKWISNVSVYFETLYETNKKIIELAELNDMGTARNLYLKISQETPLNNIFV